MAAYHAETDAAPPPDRGAGPESGAAGARRTGAKIALAVDLDGTLIASDTLHESAIGLVSRGLPELPSALKRAIRAAASGGKAAVKAAIADRAQPDPALLPYREEALELIREARAAGREVALVTAADQRLADAVAGHLGLFDAAYGSDGTQNLGGSAKADFLVGLYGEQGFDYMGDARRDLLVWARARQAVTVGARASVVRAADALSAATPGMAPALHLARPPSGAARLRPYLKAVRPHQWAKNLLIFLPCLAAHRTDWATWEAALLAFVAFSITASSVYALNDLLDLEADRAHPRKRLRPFAAGTVPVSHGVAMAALLLVAGFAIAASVSMLLLGVLALYYGATLLYSMVLKRELVIDICALAGLYTVRVIAGSVAAGLALSPWMLALSSFLFLALAAMKRQTELVDLAGSGRSESAGRAYRAEDLPVVTMMAIGAGYTAVLVLALYIYSPAVRALYESPLMLWGAPPIMLYWISRLVMIAHRGGMEDDPVFFAIRDPISVASGAGIVAVGVAARFL